MAPPSIDESVGVSVERSTPSEQGSASSEKSKDQLWKGAITTDIGDGLRVQMVGMDSKSHIVYARVLPPEKNPTEEANVTVGKVVETMVEVEWKRLIKEIMEKHKHIENDSHPPAKELLRLGAVWLINETEYAKGGNGHARLLKEKDESLKPNWENFTVRVHYMPDRFHMANEVDWSKYCKGLLLDGTIDVSIAGEKPHVPLSGLPDLKDGVIIYEVSFDFGNLSDYLCEYFFQLLTFMWLF